MSRTLNINDILVYSEIYGLGLTEMDKLHLESVRTVYDSKVDGRYIYKPASKSFDLTLNFFQRSASLPVVVLTPTSKEAVQHGYPLFSINRDIYLKGLPPINDLGHLGLIVKEFTSNLQTVYSSIDEIKETFIKSVLPARQLRYVDIEFIQACFWAAGLSGTSKGSILTPTKADIGSLPSYIRQIVAVLQLPDDTRIAFYVQKHSYGGWSSGYDMHYYYYFTKPGDPVYNFTDQGHYISHPGQNNVPKVVYTDPNMTFPKDESVMSAYRQGKDFLTMDKQTMDNLTRRWMRKQQDAAAEAAAVKTLEGKIKTKIDELKSGKTFTYNDMQFSKDTIEYENQKITDTNVTTKSVLEHYYGSYSEEHLNFENVFDTWLDMVIGEVNKKLVTTGTIGDVTYDISVKETTSTSKTGRRSTLRSYYVNGSKINRDEVKEVLKRALCFPTTGDFVDFCDSVSACSLEYHKLITSGIQISAHDEVFGDNIEFQIALERNRRRNSIMIGEKIWPIHNTTKLLAASKSESMTKIISALLDKSVVGMSGEDIKALLETGKAALIAQRNKDSELLDSTMKMFGIERMENVTCNNGKTLSGYLVHGKMRDYLVEEKKCLVFEYPTGRYLCMVDKGQNEHTNASRLVNRFFALSNDSKLAAEITTL